MTLNLYIKFATQSNHKGTMLRQDFFPHHLREMIELNWAWFSRFGFYKKYDSDKEELVLDIGDG